MRDHVLTLGTVGRGGGDHVRCGAVGRQVFQRPRDVDAEQPQGRDVTEDHAVAQDGEQGATSRLEPDRRPGRDAHAVEGAVEPALTQRRRLHALRLGLGDAKGPVRKVVVLRQ